MAKPTNPRPNPIYQRWKEKGEAEWRENWRRQFDRRPLFESGADRLLTHAENG
jgi:hypothetical protein